MVNIREFEMPRIERVIEGPDALGQIPAEIRRRGYERVLLITGSSLAESIPVSRLIQGLDSSLLHHFSGVKAHNPSESLVELVNLARSTQADVIIGIGGGSPIDAAKLTSLGVAAGICDAGDFMQYSLSHGSAPITGTPVPVIAVPTTLSAAEWNGVAAFVDETSSTKELVRYLELTPSTIVLDPELAALTPRNLWVTTGVRAIDHAVELSYATNAHPFVTALCHGALKLLAEHLPKTVEDPGNYEAALKCQQAAWMSLVGVHNVPVGLSHAIGHQLGAAGVPHGVTSCITLPHVMRFYAADTSDQQEAIARILSEARGATAPETAPDEVMSLFERLGVATRIREHGLTPEALENVVSATMGEAEATINQAPRTVTADDIRAIIEAAY